MPITTELWIALEALPPLHGEHVRLIPLVEGVVPMSAWYTLWDLLSKQRLLPYLFWMDQATPVHERGSLKYFLNFFATKAVFVVVQQAPPKVLGLVWFQQVVGHYKADIGICLVRKTPLTHAVETGMVALGWAFRRMRWHAVYAVTPWRHARDLCLAVGAELVATVPGYHYDLRAKRAHPVYVLRALAPGEVCDG